MRTKNMFFTLFASLSVSLSSCTDNDTEVENPLVVATEDEETNESNEQERDSQRALDSLCYSILIDNITESEYISAKVVDEKKPPFAPDIYWILFRPADIEDVNFKPGDIIDVHILSAERIYQERGFDGPESLTRICKLSPCK